MMKERYAAAGIEDGQRTMLTEDTKNAIAVIESVDPLRQKDLEAALDTLADRIENS